VQHNDANFGIGTLAALTHIWVVIAGPRSGLGRAGLRLESRRTDS